MEQENRSYRILLVGDDENDYLFIRDLLAKMSPAKYTLQWAGDREAAMGAIDFGEYDLCLLEYRPGEQGGWQLLRRLKADGKRTPVIVLIDGEDHSAQLEAARAGAADYLIKSQISAPLLERTIRYAIEQKEREDERESYGQRFEEMIEARTVDLLRAFEEAERRAFELDAALNSIADGVVIFGRGRKPVRINSMASFLLHWSPEGEERPIEELLQSLKAKDADGRELPIEELPVMRAYRGDVVFSQVLSIEPSPRHNPRWVACSAAPIRARNGEVTGVAATFTNITQQWTLTEKLRKARAELELRVQKRTAELEQAKGEIQRQNVLFKSILDQAADGIFVTDARGTALLINKAAKRMALRDWKDHSLESLEVNWGKAYDPRGELIPPENWSIFLALQGRTIHSREARMVRPDGSYYDVLFSTSPLRDPDGTIIGAVSTFSDITERKRSEEALKKSESELRKLSSRLLSAQEDERKRIAGELHDSISSSLSAIKMSLGNLVQKADLSAETADSIAGVMSITQQTIDETRRIMNALRPSMLDDLGLVTTIESFCRSFQSIHPDIFVEREIAVEDSDIPETLKTVIYRILQEAFNNIAKHSRAEFVELTLRKEGDVLQLFIEDNGEGFDLESVLQKEDFWKGLGLTSMRERTELSGGAFDMHSAVGEGTTIRGSWNLAVHPRTELVSDAADRGRNDLPSVFTAKDVAAKKQGRQALCRSEEKCCRLLDSIDEGFVVIEMIYDDEGNPADWRFLKMNRAFVEQTGLENAVGRTARELLPEVESDWMEACGQIAATGEARRFTQEVRALGKWFEVYAFRVDEPDKRRVGVLGRDVTAQRRVRDELELRVQERTAELEGANQELRSVPSKLIAAQEEERKRLAAELHDSVGQTLAALKYGIETVLALKNRGNAEQAFQQLGKFVPDLQRAMDETRTMYTGLLPRSLEEMGLAATLQWFCREFMMLYPQHHVELEVELEEEHISETLKIAIFRIVQEALNNVARHSKAEWVDLTLKDNETGIELIVADDGIGMDVSYIRGSNRARDLGVTGMKERAQLTGGFFSLDSTPGEGTTVHVVWPSMD